MARTLAACLLPAVAIGVAWLRIEDPVVAGDALAVIGLALLPALVPWWWARWIAVGAVTVAVAWVAFEAKAWELLPWRDERVLVPLGESIGRGLGDFYRVLLPFHSAGSPEMHGLTLAAVFGFILAVSLLVAAKRPVAAAAVTVVGVGWPATLLGSDAVLMGALALGAALSIPLVSRVRTGRALLAGAVAAALVVVGAAWVSSVTTIARSAALDWASWDHFGGSPRAAGVEFAWNSNYEGITFPRTKTVVLEIEGPKSAHYWRASTLDMFSDGHWFENLFWGRGVDADVVRMPRDALQPRQARNRRNLIEQRVEVRALVDDRLAAAGTPIILEARGLGTIYPVSGGVVRAGAPPGDGGRYKVWSYAPDPAPAALARSRPVYPSLALAYLELQGREFLGFGRPGHHRAVSRMLNDPSYRDFRPYSRVYAAARRVAGDARTPYAAVLALEAWFRQRGGFRYDEQPPQAGGPPLVDFVTRTKAGYCQHFAGAMTLMLRLLGIPSRVAVGFRSGSYEDGRWVVTDHDAHAWVEVWFAGHGWVPFDPTTGRATFGGDYSFASDSEEAVAALGRGELNQRPFVDRPLPDGADVLGEGASESRPPSLFALVVGGGVFWIACVGLVKTALRRGRYLTRDPRRRATASRKELESYLRDQGIAVPPGATLDDLRRTVAEEFAVDAQPYADAAGRARFGRAGDADHAATLARVELRSLLRRARSELSLWDRFRGLLSLRSLRGGSSL